VAIALESVLLVRVSVDEVVTIFTPSIVTTPADPLAIVVSVACPSSMVPRPNAVEVEEVKPLIGKPVAFVNVPLDGVPSAPPEVSSVADVGIVVELIVSPAIFVTVEPEVIDVDPSVGAEYEDTVPHEAVEPSVVKYLPELPVCEGRLTGAVAHSTPFAAAELAVRM